MGHFAEAAQKANYLSGVREGLSAIGSYLEKKRQKQEAEAFYKDITDKYNKYLERQKEIVSTDAKLKPDGQVSSVFSPESLGGSSRLGKSTGMNLFDIKPEGGGGTIREKIPSLMPEPTAPETQTEKITDTEKYNESQKNLGEFESSIAPLILDPDISADEISRLNVLGSLSKAQTERMKPKNERFTLSDGGQEYMFVDGKPVLVAENKKDPNANKKNPLIKVTADGYFAKWDEDKQDFVKTNTKAPAQAGDQLLAWEKFKYEQEQDKEKESKKKKDTQAKYNAIMGSEFVPMKDLIKQGLVDPDTDESKYGGAYVVRDDKNYKNYKLIYTNKELEDYAKNQVSETPNKWEREKKADNDPLGIR